MTGSSLISSATVQDMDVVLALLKIAPGVSRVHASRRVFEQLQQQEVRGQKLAAI